jgi:hypothetical protein
VVPVTAVAGSVGDAVLAFVGAAGFPPEDPRAPLCVLAVKLAQAADREPPDAAVARQLAQMLVFLGDHPAAPAGQLEEIQIRRLARRAVAMLEAP